MVATATQTRPTTLDALSPQDAASRVGDFIGSPQSSGEWGIGRFTVSDVDEAISRLRALTEEGGRWTAEGEYVKLTGVRESAADGKPETYVMMSNTPDEIRDHVPFMEEAEGNVLVTGLGLSCVVSGLLANDDVDHIDVVELSSDVISMVAPAYDGESRVTIHHNSATTFPLDGRQWDYAWHDIWARISMDNLAADSAESNVAFRTLFERYASHAAYQAAWSFDLAVAQRQAYDLRNATLDSFEAAWPIATPADRLNMLIEYHTSGPMAPPPDAFRQLIGMNPDMEKELLDRCEKAEVPSLYLDERSFMEQAKEDATLGLVQEEVESYGLSFAANGLVTKP